MKITYPCEVSWRTIRSLRLGDKVRSLLRVISYRHWFLSVICKSTKPAVTRYSMFKRGAAITAINFACEQQPAEIVSSGSFHYLTSIMALTDWVPGYVFNYLKKTMHVRPAYGIFLRGISLLVQFFERRLDLRDLMIFHLFMA